MARRPVAAVPTQRVLSQGIADLKTRNAIDELSKRIANSHAASMAEIAALKTENAGLRTTVAQHDASLKDTINLLHWTTRIAVSNQPPGSQTGSPIGIGGPPPTPTNPPAGTDNGDGNAGFLNAFPTGTAPPGSPLTAYVAGQIVGGVANQFQANYFSGTAGSQAILDSWRECFNNRCIFHLNAAGFQTSHYGGSGAGSVYLILINIPDVPLKGDNQYAYQITNYNPTLTLAAQMLYVAMTPGGSTTPDPGIPDSTPCP